MAFWKKFYKSKYTGAEIDAAVAAGSQVPEIDIEDAGKILGVDAEGKIIAKTDPVPTVTGDDIGKTIIVNDQGKYEPGFIYKYNVAPNALNIKINTAILGMAAGIMADYKYHKATVTIDTSDPDFDDIYAFLADMYNNTRLTVVRLGSIGDGVTNSIKVNDNGTPSIAAYGITAGLGFGEIVIIATTINVSGCSLDIYARRCEVAT